MSTNLTNEFICEHVKHTRSGLICLIWRLRINFESLAFIWVRDRLGLVQPNEEGFNEINTGLVSSQWFLKFETKLN